MNFGLYFQYDWKCSMTENCETLKSFLPVLKNVHVFNIIEKDEKTSRLVNIKKKRPIF